VPYENVINDNIISSIGYLIQNEKCDSNDKQSIVKLSINPFLLLHSDVKNVEQDDETYDIQALFLNLENLGEHKMNDEIQLFQQQNIVVPPSLEKKNKDI